MPSFGNSSLRKLKSCHPYLQLILNEAIEYYDFTILEGHRSKEKQNKAYRDRKSRLKYPLSKHNKKPSLAVDIAPWPIDWGDKSRFYYLAGYIEGIAKQLNIHIRWGGDWDMDGDFKDQSFHDLPHFELI